MTRRSFKDIPINPKLLKKVNPWEWQGGKMVIGVVYRDGEEIAKAWVGHDGSIWAGAGLLRLMSDAEIGDEMKVRLRYLGVHMDETYGSGGSYDCGQSGRHINYKKDSRNYPVKLFVPHNQEQFE